MPRKKGKGKSKASAPKKHKATEGSESAAQPPEYTSTGDLPPPFPEPGPHPGDDSSHVAPRADAGSGRSTIVVDEQGNEIKRYVTVTDDRDGKLLAVVLPNNELRIVLDDEHSDDRTFRTRRADEHENITVDERPPFLMGIVGRGPDEYAHAEDYAYGVLECFADTPDPPKTRNTSGANATQWDLHIIHLTGIIKVLNAEDSEKGHVFSRGLAGPNVDEVKEKILAKSKIWRPATVIYNSALNEGADLMCIEGLVAAIAEFISNYVPKPSAFANNEQNCPTKHDEGSTHAIDDSEAAFVTIGTMEFCECCPNPFRPQENDDKGASGHETAIAVSAKVPEVEIPHQSHHWVKWVQSYRNPREPPYKIQSISEMSFAEEGENTNAVEDEAQRQWEVSEEEKNEAVKKKKKKKSKKKKKAVEKGTEGSIPPPTESPREESEKVSEDHTPPATEPPLEESEKVTEISTPPATKLPAGQSEKGTEISTPPPTEPLTDVFEKEDGGSDSLQPPEEQMTDFKVPVGSSGATDMNDQSQWLVQNRKRDEKKKRGGKYPTPTEKFSPQWRGGSRKRFRGQKSKLAQEVEQLKQSNGESTGSPPTPIEPPGSGESTLPPSSGVQYDTHWPLLGSSSTFASPKSNPLSLPDSGFASDNANLGKLAHQKEPEENIPELSGADEKLDVEHQDANTAVIDSGGLEKEPEENTPELSGANDVEHQDANTGVIDGGGLENQDTKNINAADGISVQAEENTFKEKVSLKIMKSRDVRGISGHNPKAGGLRKVYYFSKGARDLSKENPPAMTEPARKCKINFLAIDDTDSSLCAYNPSTVPLAITMYTPVDIPPVPPTGGSDEAQASLNRDISGKPQPLMTEHESLKVRVEHLETITSYLMNNNTTLSYNTSTLPQTLQANAASFTPSYMASGTSFIPQHTAPNTPSMPQYTATGASFPANAASNAPFMNQYTDPNSSSMNQYTATGAPFMNQYTDPNASSMNQYTATGAPFMNQYTATGAPFMDQYPATGTPFIPANTATGSYHTGGQGYQNSHHTHGHGQWLPPHPHTQPPAPITSADMATNSATIPKDTTSDAATIPKDIASDSATIPEDSATIPEESAIMPEDSASDSATRPRNTASTQAQTLRRTKSFSQAQKVVQ